MKIEAFPAHCAWQLELLLYKMICLEGIKPEDMKATLEVLEGLPIMEPAKANVFRLKILYTHKWKNQFLVDRILSDTYMEKAGDVVLELDEELIMAGRDSLEDTAGMPVERRVDALLENLENR